jgi:hypothetical protein
MSHDYDPDIDGYRSWRLAIAEIRRRGVISGRFDPVNEQERQWLREGRE